MLRLPKNILRLFAVAVVVSVSIILSSLPSFALSQVTDGTFATSTFEIMAEATSSTKIATSITIVSPASMGVSIIFPDDLIYDGSIGSVGLTREPLLNMKWWGIAVYNETNNFVAECISTALPLPVANFNLGPGDYKTAISLGETKEECEAFSTAEYPLFAVIQAANFNVK